MKRRCWIARLGGEMAFRFRRSIKIAPGVRLNIGKSGGSLTIGGRGASVNFGSRGVYANLGIPGSGLSYRSKIAGTSPVSQYKSAAGSRTPLRPNAVPMKISMSLQDDGSVAFKDVQGNHLSDEYVREGKRQNRDSLTNWLQENCDAINGEIISLVNLHLTTPPPDTEITFTPTTFNEKEPRPPQKDFIDPRPNQPIPKEYGFLAKRIKFLRKSTDQTNAELQKSYEYQLERWETNKTDFESNYITKHKEYLEKVEQFNFAKIDFNRKQEERKKFIEEDRLNDPAAMQDFLEETLQTIVWPRETMISFQVVNNGTEVLLDVDLPEIEDMPEKQTTVNKRDLRLTYIDISDTQKRKNYLVHIHAIGFRLIGEVFVSLPTVSIVVFSGYSQRPNKTTGKIVDEYLYSVRVHRKKWEDINFQNLEAVDIVSCFEEFDLRRKATKTGVITPIEPF